MDIKLLMEVFRNWFNKLKPKDRFLFIVFMLFLLVASYFQMFIRPAFNRIASLQKQQQESKKRERSLVSQFPDMDKAQKELEGIKKNVEAMKLKAADIEEKLVGVTQVPKLLAELVKCADGLTIDFQSVKQKIEASKDGINRLNVELKFESSYENAANYIKRTEGISPYVKVAEIDLAQSKNDPRNLINVSLQLSAILAYEEEGRVELFQPSAQGQTGKLSIGHSPLMPTFNVGQVKRKKLELTGITYRPEAGSTAIVNDTVVKIGDVIEGRKVLSILADAVVLDNGIDKETLKVER
jgi:Tfp pilus assembly protein PilO